MRSSPQVQVLKVRSTVTDRSGSAAYLLKKRALTTYGWGSVYRWWGAVEDERVQSGRFQRHRFRQGWRATGYRFARS